MIPDFNISGVLPPYIGASPGNPMNLMSPYDSNIIELVERFGTTSERVNILYGLIEYRTLLRESGLGLTHQWIDGSFLEDVEQERSRPPSDIDIVTFFFRPNNIAWADWVKEHGQLFDKKFIKAKHLVDTQGVDLNLGPISVIQQSSYWLGLFSHRRDSGIWKGMLQIGMDASSDEDALELLKDQKVALVEKNNAEKK